MKLKILIYGGNGWIGNMLYDYLRKGHNVILSSSRIDSEQIISQEIESIKPDRIVCVTGRTHGIYEGKEISTIDYLEKEGKLTENIRDNLYGPLVLALIAYKHHIHLTYFGTGCIFEGFDNFKEIDSPNFFGSSYSVVKGFTDRLMHFFDNDVLNLRIRMPIIGKHHPRNFITKILGYKQISSIPNSMTVLNDMIPLIEIMISKMMTGTINLVNPGTIAHNEILKLYKKYVNNNITWENVDQSKLNIAAKRSNNSLDTSKIQSLFPNIPNIKDSVENLIKNWEKEI